MRSAGDRRIRDGFGASVAVQLLAHFTAFLRFQRQGGRGACQQARNADGLAGFLAPAVFAAVDACDRLLHLLQQLALAVARAQFQRMLFLDGGAVGRIRDELRFAQVLGGFARVGRMSCSSCLSRSLKNANWRSFM